MTEQGSRMVFQCADECEDTMAIYRRSDSPDEYVIDADYVNLTRAQLTALRDAIDKELAAPQTITYAGFTLHLNNEGTYMGTTHDGLALRVTQSPRQHGVWVCSGEYGNTPYAALKAGITARRKAAVTIYSRWFSPECMPDAEGSK